jgi:adenine deaminase
MAQPPSSPAEPAVFEGRFLDVDAGRVRPARMTVRAGRIEEIRDLPAASGPVYLPGLVDAHVHVESSMLPPPEFARLAVVHGTVATVSDPHEIANVLGAEGVRWMVAQGARVPFKFCFGAPSCVPATAFETAGARLDAAAVAELLDDPAIGYLAEVMNYPGVLHGDPELLAMIAAARQRGKPVDGHAPGLRGEEAARYAAAGITTDHECFTLDEALDKLAAGMHILIREGSAARNFDALASLIDTHPDRVMLCSDDKHPNDLVRGHLNSLLARAVARGSDPVAAVRAATRNPVRHYGLPVGLLREGDPADFAAVADLRDFRVLGTWIDGAAVAAEGRGLLPRLETDTPNRFAARPVAAEAFRVARGGERIRAIRALDGQLVTEAEWVDAPAGDPVPADPGADLLKITVVNRYADAPPAMAFVRGVGLRSGALASTVAHDSHNIVAVGADDASLARAVNALVAARGGIAVADAQGEHVLPLPIAGLMATGDGHAVGARYEELDARAKALGSPLGAPFMTLSFLALLVIPALKLSDRGLFDGARFGFVETFG